MKHEDIKIGDKLLMRWPLDHRQVEVVEINTDWLLVKIISGFRNGHTITALAEWLEPIEQQECQ